MALSIGNESAASGMSQAIYNEINRQFSPLLEQAVENASDDVKPAAQEALDKAREGWQKLAFAIATGVINHIVNNMEIYGVETQGNIKTTVKDNVGTASNVVFTQKNNGPGLIK